MGTTTTMLSSRAKRGIPRWDYEEYIASDNARSLGSASAG